MQNKAPAEYRVTLDYIAKTKPRNHNHDYRTKGLKYTRGGRDEFTKKGNDLCTAHCTDKKMKKAGCYGDDSKFFNAIMTSKKKKRRKRKFRCLGSKGAVDPNMKFWDKDTSGKLVWKDTVVCPDAYSAKFDTATNNLVCKWKPEKVNSELLKKLKRLANNSEIAQQVYNNLQGQFCNVVENLNKRIDDQQTCLTADKEQKKLVAYCSIKDKIKPSGDPLCQPIAAPGDGKLSATSWDNIATAYCKKHKNDEWCACYNVRSGVCKDKNTKAAGCKSHFEKVAALKAAVDGNTFTLMARKPTECLSDVCHGGGNTIFRYQSSPNPDCSHNLNICNTVIKAGVAENSPITANCSMSSSDGDKPKTAEEEKKEKDETKELLDTVSKMGPLDSGDSSEKKSGDKKGGGLSPGAIAGISVGGLIFCFIIIGAVLMTRK